MKLFGLVFSIFAIALFLFVPAGQSATFEFDPNDLIDLYDEGAPLSGTGADNPRSIKGGFYNYPGIGSWNSDPGTYDGPIATDYKDWRDTYNGYLTEFNIWLADNPRARGWGERLVIRPDSSLSVTADADGFWQAFASPNDWYDDLLLGQWWMDETGYELTAGGADIGTFSFTADVYVDTNENGWDENDARAVLGQDYTIWFGAYAGDDTHAQDDSEILYQGTLDITATPEPTTMLLLGAGMIGLAGLGRKKFHKKD
jgi:hypothetical protein